jgi:hypothetical protein
MNSQKKAYAPVCGCTDHESVHIFVRIQANTGSDHENLHIFLTIQANTGQYELPNQFIYACMSRAYTRHTNTCELLIEGNTC